jgi:phosphoenolpyruvate carboxykinase (ATP)
MSVKPSMEWLNALKAKNAANIFEDTSDARLYEHSVVYDNSKITSTGALAVRSGKKTGRSPKDKRVVVDQYVKDDVAWGVVNIPLEPEKFEGLKKRAFDFLAKKERLYVVNVWAGWDPALRISVKVVTSRPYHALFMKTMLIPALPEDAKAFENPDYVIYNAGECPADDNNKDSATVALNLTSHEFVILGTQYAGEMKKGVFTILNYLMPKQGILSMHASCNVDLAKKQATVFFGLSGTGKTTLSTDPRRAMVGDDEHCWTDHGIFNVENGCYAKCVNLKAEDEPEIYNALTFGSVLENIVMDEASRVVNFFDISITENTRAAYPLLHLSNKVIPAHIPYHPTNVIFLTYDAFGVIPPVSRLDFHQAMYHFVNGYTSKVAGTELGVKEPEATFSTCFGEPFMVFDPVVYAKLLADRMNKYNCKVWLVNTGYVQGPYGSKKGHRIKLRHTRAILDAIHSGELDQESAFLPERTAVFKLQVPTKVSNVPDEILNPAASWEDASAYKKTIENLGQRFARNFHKHHKANHDPEIAEGGPHLDPDLVLDIQDNGTLAG